jgi:hypothetical protein
MHGRAVDNELRRRINEASNKTNLNKLSSATIYVTVADVAKMKQAEL